MYRKGLNKYLIHKQNKLQMDLSDYFLESIQKESPVQLKQFIGRIEKMIIIRILNEVNGNQRVAAKLMGVKPTTLNEKIKKYNIRLIQKNTRRPSFIFPPRFSVDETSGWFQNVAGQSVDLD